MQDIQSPCVGVCAMNEATGLCVGCYRTIEEIAQWWDMNNLERSQVMIKLQQREQSIFD